MTFIVCASRLAALYETYHYAEDLKFAGARTFAGLDIELFIHGVSEEIGILTRKIQNREYIND